MPNATPAAVPVAATTRGIPAIGSPGAPLNAPITAPKKPWKKRVIIGSTSLLIILVLLVGGVFFYAKWRFDQIHREKVVGLAAPAPGQPFNILLVGSDSRQFVGDNSGEAGAFGSASDVGGQRSDVIIIARIVPATRQIKLLSIPRDTWVDIPGSSDVAGPNRINAAYASGPSLLVQTIASNFHIPVSYYTEVNFPGFSGMVGALGGVGLDFPDLVKDTYTGLNINHTGCQLIKGGQALALVRSRHLEYYTDGYWHYDGLSDFSRIQRQDAFFRAIVSKIRGAITNPLALNSFLGAATKYLTVDQTLSEGQIVNLAKIFRSFSSSELVTQTLPTTPFTTDGGADVLSPVPSADNPVIAAFLAFGTSTTKTTAALTKTSASGAVLTDSSTSTSTVTPITSIENVDPSQSQIDYNTQLEPWNPTPCNP